MLKSHCTHYRMWHIIKWQIEYFADAVCNIGYNQKQQKKFIVPQVEEQFES